MEAENYFNYSEFAQIFLAAIGLFLAFIFSVIHNRSANFAYLARERALQLESCLNFHLYRSSPAFVTKVTNNKREKSKLNKEFGTVAAIRCIYIVGIACFLLYILYKTISLNI